MRTALLLLIPMLPAAAWAEYEAKPVELEYLGQAPTPDYSPPVAYPKVAKKLGKEADCKLKVSIDKKGRTTQVESMECDSLFSKRSELALRQWTWEPWRIEGKKSPHTFELIAHFRVEEVVEEEKEEKEEASKEE